MPDLGALVDSSMNKLASIEDRINSSTFGRVFRLDGSGHPKTVRGSSFFREIRAGLTTFATMAYIVAVNKAAVLADSGGTCECPPGTEPGCPGDLNYANCQAVLKRDLITATAAIAGLASILFGFLTNLPVALGPGMGLNAYFTYQVVGWHGTGKVPYRIALTAIFVEGFIFIFLALTGMRQWLVRMIPATIKTACGVGIGLFLTEIGLSYSAGIGAITGGFSTPLAIGGCPAEYLDSKGECASHIMENPGMWIGIFIGGIFVAFLMAFKVKSAIIIGIGIVSIMSWPRNTPFTYFPYTEAGEERFQFFKQVVAFHPIESVLNVNEWNLSGANGAQFALALITFLYVDIIDCTATLYSMAKFCGVVRDDGDFPRSTIAYCTDAFMISIGSLFGCSPTTAFIESGAGIAEGGRTGLTAISAGVCFLICLFFAPILASVPPWATGSTLILVGCLMIRQVININWQYIGDAVPSFITLAFMPFSYSVAYGLIAGMMVYVVLNTMIWVVVRLTKGRVVPSNWHEKEVYDWGMASRDVPGWMKSIQRRILPTRFHIDDTKDDVELVDNDSAINAANSISRSNSAEDNKDVHIVESQVHPNAHISHISHAYSHPHAQPQVQPQPYPHTQQAPPQVHHPQAHHPQTHQPQSQTQAQGQPRSRDHDLPSLD
ncbi:xanthine/uracil permease family protein-like protein [Annulohypoxylon maeteangense]|uniref:xanthine/uracil permease family protein-like protein n=1 Tax=Annulohypoxylon maeteangense TaxID=1927788 RepID=UPI002007D641|nr:xanthine/uracil permease family protein-like protein [Annulohypoxylon maeteangense]KAI0881135.1 xanthine/uracil permease family protein-like protein [Annulohypoxylon maeteangense]